MCELSNRDVQTLIHKTLDPLMKKNGFRRKGRTYYKKLEDMIFVLQTGAVGAYFSSVTNWPSHAFSVWDGIWVDGISPGYLNKYPSKSDAAGIYIPQANTCFHMTGDVCRYGINRRELSPYWSAAQRYGVEREAERKRSDLWVMPDSPKEQTSFLQELVDQVQTSFLDCYMQYLVPDNLKKLVLDGPLRYNQNRGYKDGMVFRADSSVGNLRRYLQLAVLFHQKYGAEEEYLHYLKMYEEWAKVHKVKIEDCYYCGYGNTFRL